MGAVHDVATGTPIEVNANGSINVNVLGTLTLAAAVDVSDRVGRLLGHVTIDNASLAVTGPLTDTQLRATAVPISGTITASGPLTDTQLRATAVPVSGTVTANTGLTQPLTDTQLRASAVPVSGTVTASGPLTDTQLRATAVPVSGSGTFTTKETRSTAGAPTSFAASVSSATVLASNGNRFGATIYNNNAAANLYVKLGATATTTAGGFTVKIAAGGYYEVPYGYTGIIDGIWDSASGNAASVTELT